MSGPNGAAGRHGRALIGISGWRYAPWRGAFYPADLPQRLELWYASRVLPTIEINGSFYSMQKPAYFKEWYEATPEGFVFAVKGPRFITHMKKLRDVEIPLANFFASGVLRLREKLGPILWQFPPNFRFDAERVDDFLRLLPRTSREAARMGRRHDHRLKARASLAIDADRELRYAMEIRHESFVCADFVRLLRSHGVALVVAETAGKWPLMFDVTADFIYLRLHGDQELYRSGYGDRALARWAARIQAWQGGDEPHAPLLIEAPAPKASGRAVFCYFDNTDVKLRAPIDAQTLMEKLGIKPGKPDWSVSDRPPAKHVVRRTPSRLGQVVGGH